MRKTMKKITSFLMILTFGILMVVPLTQMANPTISVKATATTDTSTLSTYQKNALNQELRKNATTADDLMIWQYGTGSMYVSTNLTSYASNKAAYSGYTQYTSSASSTSDATGTITVTDSNYKVFYLKYDGVTYYGESLVKDCETKTYYMVKDWVEYDSFYDKEFDSTSLLTDTGIFSHTNMLGTAGYPENPSFKVLVGDSKYEKTSGEHIFFQFSTSTKIKAWDFSIDISLYDTSTKKYVPLVIWINGGKPVGEDITEFYDYEVLTTITGEPGLQTFNLEGKEINNITILPESLTWKSSYKWIIGHFQVDKYAVFEDVGEWTEEKPSYETSYKQEQYCLSTGEFSPLETDWAPSATVFYSPSWSEFSYEQYEAFSSQLVSYDFCRGEYNDAYSADRAKTCLQENDGGGITYKNKVTVVGEVIYEDDNTTTMYSNKFEVDTGITGQYVMYPVHWTNSNSDSYGKYISESTDSSWCEHTTGSTAACWKWANHHPSNSRLNSWNIDLFTWTAVPDAEKTLSKVSYTITNSCANGNISNCTNESTPIGPMTEDLATTEFYLGSLSDIENLQKDGVYTITSVLTDKGGRTAVTEGGEYLIDGTAPEMSIDISADKKDVWLSNDVTVDVKVIDKLSGLSSGTIRVYNQLSDAFKEEGIFTETSRLTIVNNTGIYYVTAHATDKAGNSAAIGSDLIYIDTTKPTLHLSSNQDDSVYTNSNVVISYSGVDNHSGLQYYIMPDGSKRTDTSDGTYTVTSNGMYTFQVCDNAYPTPNCTSKTMVVDEIDTTEADIEYIPNSSAWINKVVPVEVKMTDTQSGLKQYTVSLRKQNADGTTSTTTANKTLTETVPEYSHFLSLSETGIYTISTSVIDGVGNNGSKASGTYYIDMVKPTVELEFSHNADTLWSSEDVTVTVVIEDIHSGIDTVTLPDGTVKKFNGANTGETSFVVKEFGLKNAIIVKDVAGNVYTTYANPLIDKEDPDIDLSSSEIDNVWTKSAEIYYEATDELSGLAYMVLPDGTKKYFTEDDVAWTKIKELDQTYGVLCADDNATFEILSPAGTSLEKPYVLNTNIGIVKGTYTSSLLNGTISWTEQVVLKPGYNEIVFEPLNCDDEVQFSESVFFYYDNNAPLIKIESHDATTVDAPFNAEGVDKVTLSGAATDEIGIKSFTINGESVTVASDGTWSYELTIDEGKNEYVLVATDAAGNVTSKRFYTTKSYAEHDITYNAQGGVMPSEYVTKYTAEFEVALPRPTKDHYDFIGWVESTNLDGTPFTKLEKGTRGAKNLVAVYETVKYDIIYNLEGGTNVSTNPNTYHIETTTFTLAQPTRTGYLFAGWTGTGLSTATKTVTINKGSYGDRNYTATWTPITYQVRYNANTGSGTMENSTHTYDEAKNLNNNEFYKSGYVFVGWSLSSVGASEFRNKESIKNLTDVNGEVFDLYAVWKLQPKTYSVVYKTESGITLGTTEVTHDSGATATVVPEEFKGYTTPASQSVKFDTDGKTITFTYKPITYDIQYVLNNGSVATANPSTYNIETATITLNNPTRIGYTFAGWTGSNGSTPSTTVQIAKGSIDDKLFVANWTPNKYTYTVEHKSTSGLLLETQQVTYEFDTTNAIKPISIDGYNNPTPTVQNIAWDVAKDGGKTITFKYSPITYTIGYDFNAGLPDGYRLVSYIQSTGTQYIDTGYVPTSENLRMYIEFSQTASAGSQSLYGSEDNNSSTKRQWSTVAHGGAGSFANYVGNTGSLLSSTTAIGTIHKYETHANNGTLTVNNDGTVTTASYSGNLLKTYNIFLFANNIDGTAGQKAKIRLYGFKIYDNEVLVRDYVPAVNSAGVIGLYDLKNNRFYTNAGTGTFTTGPAISEYITSYSPEAAVTIPNISKVGYTFTGWTDKDTTTPTVNYVIPQRSYGNRTLKANWTANDYTYNIVYKTNSGTVLGTATLTKKYGTTNSIAPKAFTGYDSPANQAIVWDSVTPKTITFVYSPSGYTNTLTHRVYGGDPYVEKLIGSTTFQKKYGETVTYNSTLALNPIPNGTTLTHFRTNVVTGSGARYEIGYEFTQPSKAFSTTVYYKANEYTITYNLNNGTNNASNPSKYTVFYGVDFAAPSRTGYTFSKWTDESGKTITGINSGKNMDETNAATLLADINSRSIGNRTVTANWTANTYSVKYNANGGSGTMTNTSHTYDVAKALSVNAFVRTGYKFKGWATSASGAVAYTNGQSVSNLTATNGGTVNLYAIWEKSTYTITYDLAGGSVATANPTSYNIDTATFTLNNPTRSGYSFTGWTEQISTTDWYSGFININSGEIQSSTQYPNSVYSELIYLESGVKYTISGSSLGGIRWRFYGTDGTFKGNLSSSSTFTPTENGYVRILLFEGCTEANRNAALITSSQGTSVSIVKGSTGNRKYTANWSANSYTVNLYSNLLYGLEDTTSAVTANRISYTINNKAITGTGITEGNNDCYGYTTGRVMLEAGKTYRFMADYTGTWGSDVQVFFMLDGSTSVAYYNMSSANYTFSPSTSGEYWLRLDVNKYDDTQTVSNIIVTEVIAPITVTYGSTYSNLPTLTREGYVFVGWVDDSVTKKDASKTYKNNPWTYYADKYSDLYSAFAYDEAKLENHWRTYTYGGTETRVPYQYTNTTTVTKTANHSLYALWMAENNTTYVVNHYIKDLGASTYTLHSTEEKAGVSGARITPAVKSITGFTAPAPKSVNIRPDGTTVVDYNYTRNKYTFTLGSGSNITTTGSSATGLYEYGATITLKATPATGYSFNQWTSDNTSLVSNKTTANTTFTMPAGNIKMTPSIKTVGYTITYNLAGGSVATANPTSYNKETATFTLNNPTKTGYTFAGWTGTGLSSATTTVSIAKGSTGDRSYTATWTANSYTYNIKYVSSTGKSLGTSTATYKFDTTNEISAPAKTGYTTPTAQVVDWDSTTAKTITFTYPIINYTISYTLNNGTVATANPTTYNVESAKITLNNPTRTGYTFTGWTGANGTTAQTSVSIAAGSTGNKAYTANWQINNYELKIDPNGGSRKSDGNTSVISVTKNYATTENISERVRTGYTLTGYTTKNTSTGSTATADLGGATFTFDNSTKTGTFKQGTVPITLVAQWSINSYNVTFNYNNTNSFAAKEYADTGFVVNWDEDFTIITTFRVTSIGNRYLVFGSYTGSDAKALNLEINTAGALRTYFASGGVDKTSGTIAANEDITVTFTWDADTNTYTTTGVGATTNISYSGTYSMTGNSTNSLRIGAADYRTSPPFKAISVSAFKVTLPKVYNSAIGTLMTPTKTGYELKGWYTAASGGTAISSTTKMPAANTTYYAQWQGNKYTITFNASGGTVSETSRTVYYGDAIATLPTPTRAGYDFLGWYDSSNNKFTATTYNILGDTTLTAQWKPQSGVAYKVQHWQQTVTGADTENGTNYSLVTGDTLTLSGTAGSSVTPDVNTYTGFTSPSTKTVTISGDGTTVVNYYYKRIAYQFTLGSATGVSTNGSTATAQIKYGATVSLVASPSAGYSFTQWTSSNTSLVGNKTSVTASFTMPAGDIKMTPTVSLIKYTISYTLNSGTVATANPTSYDITTATITLNNPTRAGHTFLGWTGSNGTTAQTTVTIPKGSTGNKSYTANWQVNSYKFDVNGTLDGTSSGNTTGYGTFDVYINGAQVANDVTDYSQTYSYGSTYEVKDIKALSGKAYEGSSSFSGTITAATTITLPFKTNSFTLKIDPNGGYRKSDSSTAVIEVTKVVGTTESVSERERIGYTLTGYTMKNTTTGSTATADLGGATFTFNSSTKVGTFTQGTVPITLTAQWSENSITFNYYPNNGTTTKFVTWVAKPASTSWPNNHWNYTSNTYQQTRTGYTATGYYGTTTTGGILVGEDESFASYAAICAKYGVSTQTASTTIDIYAQWAPTNYTITYDFDAGLPSGYQLLPYIQSSGTQYIDVGLKTNQDSRIAVEAYYTGNYSIFGAGQAYSNFTANSSGGYFYYNGYDAGSSTPTNYASAKHIFELDNNYAKIDGSIIHTFTSASFTSPGNLFLFGRNNGSGTLDDAGGTVRIYHVEIRNGGSYVRNMYPCKNASGVIGMYDLVEGKFYANAGTGTFTAGATYPTSYNIETASFTLPQPTRAGYTFTGWTGTGLSSATKSVTIAKGSTGNKTYTATWTANTITYNVIHKSTSGKVLGTTTASATYGGSLKVTPPAYTGYTTPSAVTHSWNTVAPKILEFVYNPTTYTITYTLNDGTHANPSSYNIESETITLNAPSRDCYTFTGWTGSNGSTPQTSVTIAAGSTGNKSYTANWEANWTYKTGNLVTMTSNSYNGFVASQTGFEGGSAYIAFDGVKGGSKLYTNNPNETGNITAKLMFPSAIKIAEIKFWMGYGAGAVTNSNWMHIYGIKADGTQVKLGTNSSGDTWANITNNSNVDAALKTITVSAANQEIEFVGIIAKRDASGSGYYYLGDIQITKWYAKDASACSSGNDSYTWTQKTGAFMAMTSNNTPSPKSIELENSYGVHSISSSNYWYAFDNSANNGLTLWAQKESGSTQNGYVGVRLNFGKTIRVQSLYLSSGNSFGDREIHLVKNNSRIWSIYNDDVKTSTFTVTDGVNGWIEADGIDICVRATGQGNQSQLEVYYLEITKWLEQ